MSTTKKILLLAALTFCLIRSSFAGTNLPFNPSTGEVTYKQIFAISQSQTSEEAYETVINWFKNTGKFTRKNTQAPNEYSQSKNKQAVDEAFTNARPLQSVDPYAQRIAAKGLVKYYGGANSTIDLLYVEYYMIIEVGEKEITATISQIKYHHFNNRTYSMRPVYSWQGGKPIDQVGTIANFCAQCNNNADINNMASFLNTDITKLLADLQGFVKSNAPNSVASR
jgi:hypothetical protein